MMKIFSLMSFAIVMAPTDGDSGAGGSAAPTPATPDHAPAPPAGPPAALETISGTLIVGTPTLQDQAKAVGELHDAYAAAKEKAVTSSAAAHVDALAAAAAHGALSKGIKDLVATAEAMDFAEDPPAS